MDAEVTDARQALVKSILETGKAAFDPSSSLEARKAAQHEFQSTIDGSSSWALLPALNALIKPNVAPEWLKPELMAILTRVPLRSDGVRGTMEFIFSVHPSSILKSSEAAEPQKRGANITQEALAVATRIVTSPPAAVPPETWFKGIAPQLFHMIDGHDGEELARAASQMVMYGVLGKKQSGAPGSPGWIAFIEPILGAINPDRPMAAASLKDQATADIIDLTKDAIMVTADQLRLALQRLAVLLNSTPYPAQTRRVLDPVLPHLWAIATWSRGGTHCEEAYCQQAKSLLQTFFKIASTPAKLLLIVENLLHPGGVREGKLSWTLQPSTGDGLEIARPASAARAQLPELDWEDVQQKSQALVDLVASSCTADEVSAFFLDLLGRWLVSTAGVSHASGQILVHQEEGSGPEMPMRDLCEVAILHKMLESIPTKLISRVEQVLELVCHILDPENLEAQPDDVLAVALSLLNLVITAPTFKKSNLKPRGLAILESGLAQLAEADRPEISPTAKNLALLLQYREVADEMEGNDGFVPTNRQVEDRNTYKLALSYITQQDNPPPVRSEGLNLISKLVVANSPALDIQSVLVLLSSLLQDSEDFINLRVIKVFTQMASRHPKATTKEILDHYVDAKETATTDTRLRFGEALSQVVERLGETFAGDVAKQVVEALLSIAGRRGHRPKTEAKQAREARAQEMKKKQAEDAWGGEVPDLSDELSEQERAKNEILAQMVEGWESKRGSEDVRMRASALSILAGGIETNISGVGADLVSGSVDLCINVLALEPELEKGILRRAAVLLVLSFVRALDNARQTGQRLGFGLSDPSREDISRVIKYVAVTDNDGLVQQHARDVIESLESWQMSRLMPTAAQEPLSRFAGLTGIPGLDLDRSGLLAGNVMATSYDYRKSYNTNTATNDHYDDGYNQRESAGGRRNPRIRSSDGTVSTTMSSSTGRESAATHMTEGPAYSKKIVVVGDGGCGKTCLLISYSQGYFPEKYVPTVFENYITYPVHPPSGKIVELALWDTAGQEEYDRLRPLSYPETDLIFVCFAIDCPNSLENVMDKWYPEVLHFCPYTPLVLVALKSDLRFKKTCIDMLKTQGLTPVTTEQGMAVAKKMSAQYMECSSKEMKGVDEIFERAIQTVVANDRKNLEAQQQMASASSGKASNRPSGGGASNFPGGPPKKKKRNCKLL
ncbi:hypothetical protein F5X68DRAFT_278274 [Plectosphaerella plurivora]|uniref:Uncharacterized protein n=1 Tax=Plectosphaerella plurivora TaxID=936078 RepID=A0A9P8V576_9PEZI|nr:hypothetical protein F5X68DRAFT_278274 [Plectosphaerella plurivora]